MYLKLFLLSLLIAIIAIYFNSNVFYSLFTFEEPNHKNIFTLEDLKLFDGVNKPELYLAILGKVFDVTKGKTHYGPGCAYNSFIGKDTSRSFVTGNFKEDNDEVSDLKPEDLRSLNHWLQFYKKEYKEVGKLVGRYYDSNGKLTPYGKEVKKLIKKAEEMKNHRDLEKIKFPPCNVEWDEVRGTRVWCTPQSGGISRDWVGYPRQLYQPGLSDYRCACVKTKELNANLKQYEDCDLESDSCYVK